MDMQDLNFYDDEKAGFEPSLEFLIKKENINKTLSQFNQFSNSITDLTIIYGWYKYQSEKIGETDILEGNYKCFYEINKLKTCLDKVCELKDMSVLAINAIEELNGLNFEEEEFLVSWLFKYEKIKSVATYGFEVLNNHLVKLSYNKTIIIDCSDYKESLQLSKIYDDLHWMFIDKYRPTKEHFKQEGGHVICTLEKYLSLHNVYPEIILKYKSLDN